MLRHASLFTAITAFLWLPFSCHAQDKTSNRLDWLCRTWHGKAGGYPFYETWKQTGPGTWIGQGYTIVNGDTVVQEKLRILDLGDYLVYISIAGKQVPILFTCIEQANGRWVFENREHDFPQRIFYYLQDDGSLMAGIEGEEKGQPKQVRYPMQPYEP